MKEKIAIKQNENKKMRPVRTQGFLVIQTYFHIGIFSIYKLVSDKFLSSLTF